MSQTYKITAVSPKTKTWEGKYGPMVDYYVKMEGIDAPVVVTKKPESRPPQADEELYGLLDMGNKFGPKFKAESKPFGGASPSGGGGSKPSYQPKDDKSIHAQFAIREANLQVVNGIIPEDELERKAIEFYDMIERVKNAEAQAPLPLDEPSSEGVDKVFGPTEDLDKEVKLEDIPF